MAHLGWLLVAFLLVAIIARLLTGRASRTVIRQHLKDGALVVDVRTPEEYAEDHFKDAINIPLHVLHGKLDLLGSKSTPIILYCQSGMRSGSARVLLLKAGFRHIHNAGGLADLRAALEQPQ